jgi:hypothetical protein
MKRSLLLAALSLSLLSLPAAADAPAKGTFGIGTAFSASPTTGGVTMSNGLNVSYWAADQLRLAAQFGLFSEENNGTAFQLSGGARYYALKNTAESYGLFVGGALGVNVFSPTGGSSTTRVALQLNGGGEYWFNRHFSASVSEGLQLLTNPTAFGFFTELGVNLYF